MSGVGPQGAAKETGTGRMVCISGGTSGIGTGLVAAFLAAGDRVCTFGRSPDKLHQLRNRWPEAIADKQLLLLTGDVTQAPFREQLIRLLTVQGGKLDVLVNNAGIIRGSGSLEESPEDWRLTLETNLIAPYALTQASLPLLSKSPSPAVINISSVCAQHPYDTCTSMAYSASKAGLDLMTRRLALALAPRGIRVNGLAPGVVVTEMWGEETELISATVARRHVLHQRAIREEEIAAAALYLASPAAACITGSILNVDAGYALG